MRLSHSSEGDEEDSEGERQPGLGHKLGDRSLEGAGHFCLEISLSLSLFLSASFFIFDSSLWALSFSVCSRHPNRLLLSHHPSGNCFWFKKSHPSKRNTLDSSHKTSKGQTLGGTEGELLED